MDVREAGKDFNTITDRYHLEPFSPFPLTTEFAFSNTEAEGQKVYSDQNLTLMNKGKNIEKAQAHPDAQAQLSLRYPLSCQQS